MTSNIKQRSDVFDIVQECGYDEFDESNNTKSAVDKNIGNKEWFND